MEPIKAIVAIVDEKHYIKIDDGDTGVMIPMSEDSPNEVKRAFNRLIVRLREGEYRIQFEGEGEDLFSQVATEYITQLNRDQEVFGEMENFGLIRE